MITMSWNIHFCTSKLVKETKSKTIIKVLEQLVQAYHNKGFKVYIFLGDGKFKLIQRLMEDKDRDMSIVSADKHVPKLERYIASSMMKSR